MFILSALNSVYGPPGFLAPVVLTGKGILQDLCKLNCGWAEWIPTTYTDKWKQWLKASRSQGWSFQHSPCWDGQDAEERARVDPQRTRCLDRWHRRLKVHSNPRVTGWGSDTQIPMVPHKDWAQSCRQCIKRQSQSAKGQPAVNHHIHTSVGHSGRDQSVTKLETRHSEDTRKARSSPAQGNTLPAFTRTGLDFFGPIEVKHGRSPERRYRALFKASRAEPYTWRRTRWIQTPAFLHSDASSADEAKRRRSFQTREQISLGQNGNVEKHILTLTSVKSSI